MPAYDLAKLRALGDRYRALLAEIEDVRKLMDPEIAGAIRAETPDLDIMDASGLRSRDTIRAVREAYGIPPRRPGRRKRDPKS